MAPRADPGTDGQEDGATSADEMVRSTLEGIMERLPEEFVMAEVMSKTQERSPYILVCFQECERMNILVREIRLVRESGLSPVTYTGREGWLTIMDDPSTTDSCRHCCN